MTIKRILHLISLAGLAILFACAAPGPAVTETMDELTAVTVTHGRTPLVMSPNAPLNPNDRRDYVQVGAIEVNRTGSIQYYLWLGITEANPFVSTDTHPEGFDSIVLEVGSESIRLDVKGWSHAAIGTSAPYYQKLFPSSTDAYYPVTLEQIKLLADSDNLQLITTGTEPKYYESWYRQTTFETELADFVNAVSP